MAAGSTYEPISTQTLSSAAASVTFSSIPGTYTDLVLVMYAKCTNTGGQNSYLQFNGDTSTNYSGTSFYGSVPTPAVNRTINNASGGLCITDVIGELITYHILGYSNTGAQKIVLGRGNSTSNYADSRVSLWRSTAAITSINIASSGGNWAVGSTFTIYGIAAA